MKNTPAFPNMNSSDSPILVTGVPGRVAGAGTAIMEMLRRRGLPVRALVLHEDERTYALRAHEVEVVAGDLTRYHRTHQRMASPG